MKSLPAARRGHGWRTDNRCLDSLGDLLAHSSGTFGNSARVRLKIMWRLLVPGSRRSVLGLCVTVVCPPAAAPPPSFRLGLNNDVYRHVERGQVTSFHRSRLSASRHASTPRRRVAAAHEAGARRLLPGDKRRVIQAALVVELWLRLSGSCSGGRVFSTAALTRAWCC